MRDGSACRWSKGATGGAWCELSPVPGSTFGEAVSTDCGAPASGCWISEEATPGSVLAGRLGKNGGAVRERDGSWPACGGFTSVAVAGCAVLSSLLLASK